MAALFFWACCCNLCNNPIFATANKQAGKGLVVSEAAAAGPAPGGTQPRCGVHFFAKHKPKHKQERKQTYANRRNAKSGRNRQNQQRSAGRGDRAWVAANSEPVHEATAVRNRWREW